MVVSAGTGAPPAPRPLCVSVWNACTLADRHLTGVGRHAVHMTLGLHAAPSVNLQLLLPNGDGQVHPSASMLASLPRTRMPWRSATLRWLWALLPWPSVARYCGDNPWLYCPRELWIPPGRGRTAITVHDLWALDAGRPNWKLRLKWRWLLGRALRRASLILAVSRFTADRIDSHFPGLGSKVRIVGNGAAPAYFEAPGRALRLPPELVGVRYAVSVGGLVHKKGGDRLLKFAKAIGELWPDLKLVVVGPAHPSEPLPQNLILVDRGLADQELADLVRGASFGLSLSRYEGFGITLVEAMAAGIPVIASDIPAHREIAAEAALLVPGEDVQAQISAVRTLLEQPDLRAERIAKGRTLAEQHTWARAVSRLYAALQEFS